MSTPVALQGLIPKAWLDALAQLPGESRGSIVARLEAIDAALKTEVAERIYPPRSQIFAALERCPPGAVRAVILGQDPYHGGQAHGLCFSVAAACKRPPSLRNIIQELESDLGSAVSASAGDLGAWADQGVLLLNSVLTVRAGQAGSHAGLGWQGLSDLIIRVAGAQALPAVFLLWGGFAGRKAALIEPGRHLILKSAHPSPLSAYRGFFGSKPFSRCNEFLQRHDRESIDWIGGLEQGEKE